MQDLDSLDFASLRSRYRARTLSVGRLARELLERLPRWDSHNIWIERLPDEWILEQAEALDECDPDVLPLYGLPFAVKDNIDVADLPTTAGYPEALYVAEAHAPVVERLLAAGALLIGKTNLDQFATGLNGTRSPYGACANAFDPRYIAGGSSAGSAVAVAAGLVSFALGTDTAGSGRVPAAFNNIVGLKPTRGLLSTGGVVPACRSLDCVSVFALTVADSLDVLRVTVGYAAADPFSRPDADRLDTTLVNCPRRFRFGVPEPEQLEFFGDETAARLFSEAAERLEDLGGERRIIDFRPFLDAARLLYHGPWLCERQLAVEHYLGDQWDRLLPVLRELLAAGDGFSAADAFAGYYRLKQLRRETESVWRDIDLLLTPTAPTLYTIEQLQAEPMELNNRLGYYTNFMNLLDLCALALPAGFLPEGLPFGITLAAPAWQEQRLAAVGAAFQQTIGLGMGVSRHLPPSPILGRKPADTVELFVCGAHMAGLPLNHQLIERGATLVGPCCTAPQYRLYALEYLSPPRPGLIRTDHGQAIEGELWRVPLAEFGGFVAAIPPPLAIGSVQLDDGGWTSGFVCEGHAAARGRDISALGGWQAYLAAGTANPIDNVTKREPLITGDDAVRATGAAD